MALFVGLDVSLKTTSICIVEANGKLVWEGKAASEPVPLIKAIGPWRKRIKLIGIVSVRSGPPTVTGLFSKCYLLEWGSCPRSGIVDTMSRFKTL